MDSRFFLFCHHLLGSANHIHTFFSLFPYLHFYRHCFVNLLSGIRFSGYLMVFSNMLFISDLLAVSLLLLLVNIFNWSSIEFLYYDIESVVTSVNFFLIYLCIFYLTIKYGKKINTITFINKWRFWYMTVIVATFWLYIKRDRTFASPRSNSRRHLRKVCWVEVTFLSAEYIKMY